MSIISVDDPDTVARIKEAHAKLKKAADTVKAEFEGQDELVDMLMACIMSGNQAHALIEGPPGTGKTTLAKYIGDVLNLKGGRIQCTPDLMPAEVTGAKILRSRKDGTRDEEFVKGPVLKSELLFIDEVSRASPRTQSAYLQPMQEGTVTIDGETYYVPMPFNVIATQNPRDTMGSNPLPQAQMDRFRIRLIVGNIERKVELDIGRKDRNKPGETTRLYNEIADFRAGRSQKDPGVRSKANEKSLPAVLEPYDVLAFQMLTRDMPISDQLNTDIVDLVRQLRPYEPDAMQVEEQKGLSGVFASGTDGHRTGQALRAMVRGHALMRGAYAPDISDLRAVAVPVIGHRLNPAKRTYEGEQPKYIQQALENVLA